MAKQALHDILCGVLGSPYCYFREPSDTMMKYPCIVYFHSNDEDRFADNIHYKVSKRYTVTIIDEDEDSEIPDRMKTIPYCTSDRNYVVDGLNHFIFTLYFNGPRIKEEEKNE